MSTRQRERIGWLGLLGVLGVIPGTPGGDDLHSAVEAFTFPATG